jgi:serine/threonine protein kinase
MTDRLGQRFGNYQLIRLLGKGGFAEVYLGEHVYLKTLAAIKVLLTLVGNEEADYFITEARLLMDLRHPHIVRVLEFGIEQDTPFLVMDYAPNGNMRQRYPRETRLSPLTVASYARQVASALQHAHDQKLIHRDVKPENLLLQRNDEILLSDFGIAMIARTSRSQNKNDIVGTATYMAPEQIQGKATFASDQYALGIIVYEWLSGDIPFQGSFSEICAQHVFTPPPPLRQSIPTISPNIENVVLTALAKEPQKRFASIMAFANALEHACQTDQSEQVTFLSQQPSGPFPHSSTSESGAYNTELHPLEATPQSYSTLALNESIAPPGEVNRESAPRDNFTMLSNEHQGSVAEKNNTPVPNDPSVYAANENNGVAAQPMRHNTRRGISPKVWGTALAVLAIFLSINGYLYYAVFSHADQAQIIAQGTATARATATPHLSPSATVPPMATPKPTIQPTPPPQATPTQPVATSPTQPTPTPTSQPGSILVLNDPLTAQDANQWDVFTYAGNAGGCGFSNGAYHATSKQAGTFAVCTAQATNFANFTYQVQMTILSGTTNDGGGLIFRSSNGSAYRLHVGINGTFDLVDQVKTLVSGSNPAIKTGLNQTNLLKVVARGPNITLYVNKQPIANVQDSLSSSGAIGVMAVDFTDPTDVAFTNAQVWQ